MKWTKREIRDQLLDLGLYRAEVGAKRDWLAKTVDRLLEAGRELDDDLDRIGRSTAEWSVRAGEKGVPESEVLRLLRLPRPTFHPSETP